MPGASADRRGRGRDPDTGVAGSTTVGAPRCCATKGNAMDGAVPATPTSRARFSVSTAGLAPASPAEATLVERLRAVEDDDALVVQARETPVPGVSADDPAALLPRRRRHRRRRGADHHRQRRARLVRPAAPRPPRSRLLRRRSGAGPPVQRAEPDLPRRRGAAVARDPRPADRAVPARSGQHLASRRPPRRRRAGRLVRGTADHQRRRQLPTAPGRRRQAPDDPCRRPVRGGARPGRPGAAAGGGRCGRRRCRQRLTGDPAHRRLPAQRAPRHHRCAGRCPLGGVRPARRLPLGRRRAGVRPAGAADSSSRCK